MVAIITTAQPGIYNSSLIHCHLAREVQAMQKVNSRSRQTARSCPTSLFDIGFSHWKNLFTQLQKVNYSE
ncbi:hypothetical protein Y1Q_0005311 [Alligator mississippiensis]|uniref:Uncharacterized protein n=1 Tax=Alligator mississippiensis TaxID=8496 RepID=A0A151MTD1_ALLMI|nr:hypothetical protein Y1Q_0005311 [Alligator mississippiensis]